MNSLDLRRLQRQQCLLGRSHSQFRWEIQRVSQEKFGKQTGKGWEGGDCEFGSGVREQRTAKG